MCVLFAHYTLTPKVLVLLQIWGILTGPRIFEGHLEGSDILKVEDRIGLRSLDS